MLLTKKITDEMNKKWMGKNDILGKGLLTTANRVNGSRAILFSSQIDQMEVPKYPEIPRVLTGIEKEIGKYSSAYKRADGDLEVVAKINKFGEESNEVYTLVVYNKTRKKYDVITKKAGENLTETYAYQYVNDTLDNVDEGDVIEEGQMLYHSTSFDKHGNYRYGVNAKTLYVIHDETTEDAIIMSDELAKKLTTVKMDTVRLSVNDNDILLNIYGDNKSYKSFPDIGEPVLGKILCAKRRITYSQSLYELKDDNMRKINFKNDTPQYVTYDKNKLVDINIYCNKKIEEIPDNTCNRQILKYLKLIKAYHEKIIEVLQPIMDGGRYTDDLSNLYITTKRLLDDDIKSTGNDNKVFNNLTVEFIILEDSEIKAGVTGNKFAGRFGDKGVVSNTIKIQPKCEMPMLETGEYVDMVVSVFGVPNRENPGQLYEVELNFLIDRIIQKAFKMNLDDESTFEYLMTAFDIINKTQADSMRKFWRSLDAEGKRDTIEYIQIHKIPVQEPPMYNNTDLDTIKLLYDTFEIKPYDVYIHKFGRKIKLLNPLVVGDKYVIRLKHYPKSKFSSRSTGYVNSKDTPTKSAKSNKCIIQSTPLKLGDQEQTNLAANNDVETLADMIKLYSSSIKGRKKIKELYSEGDVLNFEEFDLSDSTNRNSEILNAYLSALGMSLTFSQESDDEFDDVIENFNDDFDEE